MFAFFSFQRKKIMKNLGEKSFFFKTHFLRKFFLKRWVLQNDLFSKSPKQNFLLDALSYFAPPSHLVERRFLFFFALGKAIKRECFGRI